MEELVDEKLVRNIGLRYVVDSSEIITYLIVISNCQGSLVFDVLRYAKYEPQVLQVELHPYLSQEPLVKFCRNFGIAVTAYSSFGPQSYLELGGGNKLPSLLHEHDIIQRIAKFHKRSMLICLRPAAVLTSHSNCTGSAALGDPARYRCHSEE